MICLAKPAKVLKAIFPDNVTKIKNPIQLAEDWPKNHLIKDTICKAIHQAEDAISKAINLAKDTQGNALDKHTNTRWFALQKILKAICRVKNTKLIIAQGKILANLQQKSLKVICLATVFSEQFCLSLGTPPTPTPKLGPNPYCGFYSM